MAKIKDTKPSPNTTFWDDKPSSFLTKMIILVRMSDIKNVEYTHS